MSEEDLVAAMVPVTRRWVAAIHRGDKTSIARIWESLPEGRADVFSLVLGAMIHPGQQPEDLLGWTEDLLVGERERLEAAGVNPEGAEFLARQVTGRKDGDPKLLGLSPEERRPVLEGREYERIKRRGSRQTARERMLRVTSAEQRSA